MDLLFRSFDHVTPPTISLEEAKEKSEEEEDEWSRRVREARKDFWFQPKSCVYKTNRKTKTAITSGSSRGTARVRQENNGFRSERTLDALMSAFRYKDQHRSYSESLNRNDRNNNNNNSKHLLNDEELTMLKMELPSLDKHSQRLAAIRIKLREEALKEENNDAFPSKSADSDGGGGDCASFRPKCVEFRRGKVDAAESRIRARNVEALAAVVGEELASRVCWTLCNVRDVNTLMQHLLDNSAVYASGVNTVIVDVNRCCGNEKDATDVVDRDLICLW